MQKLQNYKLGHHESTTRKMTIFEMSMCDEQNKNYCTDRSGLGDPNSQLFARVTQSLQFIYLGDEMDGRVKASLS